MVFHVARDGAEVGQFSEQEFRDKIFSGEIRPENHYWTEGMDDWQLVSEYRSSPSLPGPPTLPPLPQMPEKKKARTESPASIGGACALLAAFAPLLHPSLFFVLSLPLLFAAFVLAIVSLVRGRVTGGICLLVGLFPALMMAFVALTERDKLLHRQPIETHSPAKSRAVSKPSQAPQAEPSVQPTSVEPEESTTPLPDTITIVHAISIPVQYGSVTLQPGTRLQVLSRDRENVVVRYLGSDYEIPISSTDLK